MRPRYGARELERGFRGRFGVALAIASFAALLSAAAALARDFDNPASTDTRSSSAPVNPQREDTPNDPDYDQAEPDDPGRPVDRRPTSTTSASTSSASPRRCTRRPRVYAGRARTPGQPMIAGFNAAGAWKVERGRPDVSIAILDTGHQVGPARPAHQIHLNTRRAAAARRSGADGPSRARRLRLQRRRRRQRRRLRRRPARQPRRPAPHGNAGGSTPRT